MTFGFVDARITRADPGALLVYAFAMDSAGLQTFFLWVRTARDSTPLQLRVQATDINRAVQQIESQGFSLAGYSSKVGADEPDQPTIAGPHQDQRCIYQVQVVNSHNGAFQTLQLRATSSQDAAEQVSQIGHVINEPVPIVEAAPMNHFGGPSYVESRNYLPDDQEEHKRIAELHSEAHKAAVLAYIGLLLCGPAGVIAMIWGFSIRSRSRGRYGLHAIIVGLIATVGWILISGFYQALELRMLGLRF